MRNDWLLIDHRCRRSTRECGVRGRSEALHSSLLLKQEVGGRCRRRRGQVGHRRLVRARRILHHGDEAAEFVEAKRRGVVARTDQLEQTMSNTATQDGHRTSARPRDLIC